MKNAYFQTPRYFRSSKGQDEGGKVRYSKKKLLLECCGAWENVLGCGCADEVGML